MSVMGMLSHARSMFHILRTGWTYTGRSALETREERKEVDVEILFDGYYNSKSTEFTNTAHQLASDYGTQVLCGGRLLHWGTSISKP